jgi:hypothetical protein
VIVKDLYVKIADEIEVYLVTVIANAHYEHTILVQRLQLFVEWERFELGPNHERNLIINPKLLPLKIGYIPMFKIVIILVLAFWVFYKVSSFFFKAGAASQQLRQQQSNRQFREQEKKNKKDGGNNIKGGDYVDYEEVK